MHSEIKVSIDDLIKLRFGNSDVKLMSGKKIFSAVTGNYSSRFRGRGMDFQEVRVYQPGDDIRNMDWRVTARTGKPHTKIFEEEREKPVLLVVDNSPGMHFGSRNTFKSVVAARASAILSWSAAANHDRVGGIVFSQDGIHEFRPQGGNRGALRLLKCVSKTQNDCIDNSVNKDIGRDSRLPEAFIHLRRVARPGSQIIVLSDFSGLDEKTVQQVSMLSRHNEMIWVFVYDELEANPPQPGTYAISDGVNTGSLNTRDTKFNQRYRDRFNEKLSYLRSICRKYRIHFLTLKTTDDVASILHHGFISGAGR